jgi:two-component system, NarL family, sensor kinase
VAGFLFYYYHKKQTFRTQLLLLKEKDSAAIAVLRAAEQERKRIAADLHDNLGAYAASIVSNLEFIKPANEQGATAMQELRHNSLAIVSRLSDTIWVLNKDALSLTSISDRVKAFIKRIQPSFPHTVMQVQESITRDHLLPPAQAYHLFQIVQEAVSNAVRHSGSPGVDVEIESDTGWEVRVVDHGRGFDPSAEGQAAGQAEGQAAGQSAAAMDGGNGLGNMRSRAGEAGWNLHWMRTPGGGTTLTVTPGPAAAQ